MIKVAEARVTIAATPEEVFDLFHDYGRRLDWDPFLRRADLEDGATEAGLGVSTWCATRWRNGGFGMRTVYVSYRRPDVAAVKMTSGPRFLKAFAASITQKALDERQTRVSYKFRFEPWPAWASRVLAPLFGVVFRHETRHRLQALKRFLESSAVG